MVRRRTRLPWSGDMQKKRTVYELLARHQAASVIATLADLSTMILLVEHEHLDPAVAALSGAASGAILNFLANRRFTFGARNEGVGEQALRYAAVSIASALIVAGGEYAGTRWLRGPYIAVRLAVGFVASICWNFPMQRAFVFRSSEREP